MTSLTVNVDPLALSVPKAAKALGVSVTLTWALVKRGDITSRRVGKRVLIPVTALKAFLAGKKPVLGVEGGAQ